jgi:hypothetical protein
MKAVSAMWFVFGVLWLVFAAGIAVSRTRTTEEFTISR